MCHAATRPHSPTPPPLTAILPLVRRRHCHRQQAALACKRFAALCGSPALLREAHVRFQSLSGADSAAAWLMRHARHVQTLELLGSAADAEPAGSLISAVATCLAVAGRAPQLAELTVNLGSDLHTEWLRTLRSLQRLILVSSDTFHIAPATASLTALQSLELNCAGLQLPAESRLPGGITRLRLDSVDEEELPWEASKRQGSCVFARTAAASLPRSALRTWLLPPCSFVLPTACSPFSRRSPACLQFAQLPQLQRLRLYQCGFSANSLSQLSTLSGSLTRLERLCGNLSTPTLAALTGLRNLAYMPAPSGTCAAAVAALPHLTGLTCLVSPLGRSRGVRREPWWLVAPALGESRRFSAAAHPACA